MFSEHSDMFRLVQILFRFHTKNFSYVLIFRFIKRETFRKTENGATSRHCCIHWCDVSNILVKWYKMYWHLWQFWQVNIFYIIYHYNFDIFRIIVIIRETSKKIFCRLNVLWMTYFVCLFSISTMFNWANTNSEDYQLKLKRTF